VGRLWRGAEAGAAVRDPGLGDDGEACAGGGADFLVGFEEVDFLRTLTEKRVPIILTVRILGTGGGRLFGNWPRGTN